MRFRLGLLLGFAIGYVLGAKAGTQRYAQIQRLWGQFADSEPAQQISSEVRYAADKAGEIIERKTAEGVEKVTDLVHGDSRENEPVGNGRSIPPA